MKPLTLIVTTLGLAYAAMHAATIDGNLDFVQIHPDYRSKVLLVPLPNHNPFRKASLTEELLLTPSDTTTLPNQIIAALGRNAVGAVLEGKDTDATVVIAGEVYSEGDVVKLTDKEGATKPVMDGYVVYVKSISRREITLEAAPIGVSKATAVKVNLPLDEFFEDR
jgi:hypothetical protein